ncbi:MAG TPA: septal ring lytic transglycosylase RlpA family protein [Polyangiaceae bacterium]|nr:septal ring lytic transglycosylase RlpA family protein [Polyangiaceae bacterium]
MSKSWLTHGLGRSSSRTAALALVFGLAGCQSPGGSAGEPPAWPEEEPPEYPGVAAPPPAAEPGASAATSASSSPWAASHGSLAVVDRFTGDATYYADSLAGNKTASGERYRPDAFSAAHRSLPFGTIARVVRTDTARATYVKINDRGPFGNAKRVIDLSRAAATELEMLRAGVVPVRVEILELPR